MNGPEGNDTLETVRHALRGWETFTEGAQSIRALLFGVLADTAWPLVTSYRSDLYHDAGWLAEYVNGPTTFYFGADSYGTAIGTDRGLVRTARKNVWRVDLVCDHADANAENGPEHWKARGFWYADLTPIYA